MNELQNFKFETNDIRVIMDTQGEPWWVAKDVCTVLDLNNVGQATADLDENEKSTIDPNLIIADVGFNNMMKAAGIDVRGIIPEAGKGGRPLTIVSEPGLYSLVFKSRKPGAKRFKKWVTSEVLPSIRKTGKYQTPSIPKLPQTYLEALKALVVSEEEKLTLAIENIQMKPKAEYFDALVDRSLLTSFRDTAKELGIKEKPFIGFLLEDKYIYRDKKGKLMPYAARNDGYFEVKECLSERTSWAGVQTFVTPKGRETFRLLTQGIN